MQLARSPYGPLGPFEKLSNLILPFAHNPQTIVTPDTTAKHGYVYAVYTLGNGGVTPGVKNCTGQSVAHLEEEGGESTDADAVVKTITVRTMLTCACSLGGWYLLGSYSTTHAILAAVYPQRPSSLFMVHRNAYT